MIPRRAGNSPWLRSFATARDPEGTPRPVFAHLGQAALPDSGSKYKSIPTPDEERRQHRIFTAEPHTAGSKRNNELADYIAAEWRKQGLEDVITRRYDPAMWGSAVKMRC